MTKFSASYFRQQIEQYFDDRELDVLCERRKRAYCIVRGDDGLRLARLRPTGRDDEVEMYLWNDDRWQPIGTSGKVMPLPDALEYITDDPDDLFYDIHDAEMDDDDEYGDDEYDDDETESDEIEADATGRESHVFRFAQLIGLLHQQILVRSLLSGALGGLSRSANEGLAVGILAAILCSAGFTGFRHGWRALIGKTLLLGIPISLVAAAAATLGGSVHQFIGSGGWASVGGALTGAISSFLMLAGRRLSWLLSFSAAFILAVTWKESLGLGAGSIGWFAVAIGAAAIANLYGKLARLYQDAISFRMTSRDEKDDDHDCDDEDQ